MSGQTVHACLIVDDAPYNPTYWLRLQESAFGYDVPTIGYGGPWRQQAVAPYLPARLTAAFADFVEEFNIRGKYTTLPCPAGHGRLDQTVRGLPEAELASILTIVRERLAPRFDITPEVLTHTMALDIRTGALLPHAETAWLSYLSRAGQVEDLVAYVQYGWTILQNVGLRPHGLTLGGTGDPSGIAEGEMLLGGYHREALCRALLTVEQRVDPGLRTTFLYSGSDHVSEQSRATNAPETIYSSADGGRVFELHSRIVEPLMSIWYGQGDERDEAAATDALITPDLKEGKLIEEAEANRAVVITVHAQTINTLNTGRGLKVLREAVRRFTERYGKRLLWHTPSELYATMGV